MTCSGNCFYFAFAEKILLRNRITFITTKNTNSKIIVSPGFTGARVIDGMTETQLLNNAYLIAAGVICCLLILKYLSKARNAISERTSGGLYSVLSFSRYAICYLVLFAIFAISSILLVGESYNPFLYFRF